MCKSTNSKKLKNGCTLSFSKKWVKLNTKCKRSLQDIGKALIKNFPIEKHITHYFIPIIQLYN